MNVGMLWFDNDQKADLQAKVARAANYYQEKYGQSPNLCYVHPSMLPAQKNNIPGKQGVEIRPSKSLLPNHFWLGVDEEDTQR